MSLSKVIETALGELKNTEFPAGSNQVIYNTDYYGWAVSGDAYKWCLVFLWWVFQKSGEKMAFFGGAKTASCGTFLKWYQEQGQTVSPDKIQVGDIVILNFKGTKETQHCGLVESRGDNPGTWYVIEGNTSPGLEGSQDNGGCVAKKLRSIKNVVGVCRPQYKPEEPAPVIPDYKGRWSEAYWEEGIRRGIIKEAKDGIYRPKDTATREEVLAMILRNEGYQGG